VARYNWITPTQFNDMHTELSGGFTDRAPASTIPGTRRKIAQGDYSFRGHSENRSVDAYKNNGNHRDLDDETEGATNTAFTNMEIVPVTAAKGNAYSNTSLHHASDLLTMQEIFGVGHASATLQRQRSVGPVCGRHDRRTCRSRRRSPCSPSDGRLNSGAVAADLIADCLPTA